MTVEIGTFTGQRNKISKTFNKEHTFDNVVLKEGTSVQQPVLLIKATTDKGRTDLITATYAHIEAFGDRYYYVTDCVLVRNQLLEMHLRVDPLMSFADKIYIQRAYVQKTAEPKKTNYYLDDGSFATTAQSKVVQGKFPPATTARFIDADGKPQLSYFLILAGRPQA